MASNQGMPDVNSKEHFEQRLQSIAQAVILGLLMWSGYTSVEMGKDVAKLAVKSEQSARDVLELKQEVVSLRTQTINAAMAAANAATAAATTAAAAAASASNRRDPR